MSKTIKNLMTEAYRQQFADVEDAVVIDIRGVKSNENNALRGDLAKKSIRVTIVKNSLAKSAFKGGSLENLEEVIDGASALVYGGESVVHVARELIGWVKKLPAMTLKGAVMDGEVFAANQMEKLSKYPTRDEAQAQVVQLFLSPAKNLASAILSGGSNIAGILKTIEEKLEKGETIQKAAG